MGTGITNEYGLPANWTPATVPTGTAFFGVSSTTTVKLSNEVTVGSWTFNAGASAYTFTNTSSFVTFTGAGIVVNGGSVMYESQGPGLGIVNGLVFENASTAGSASIYNGSSLAFTNSSTAGSSNIVNNFNLAFSGTSTAANAGITNNRGVLFSNSSTAGSASIANNFSLVFRDTSTAGNAAITNSSGPIFLNGDPYFASTDFSLSSGPGGNHKLSAGSIAGGGTFSLGQNELTVGNNNLSTTVSGVIADGGLGGGTAGSLVKVGTGVLTLSGVNTYTGATTVNAGTLSVDGSIAASVLTTVNAGATLTGIGTVGDTTINGGTLAPGHSIGTLTVQGNLVLTAAASYLIGVSPTAASRTTVTGKATLNGATVTALFAPGVYLSNRYTILSADGGRVGTFGSLVNDNLPSTVTSSLSYDANDAFLDLKLNFSVPGGLNVNQQNVANALINYFTANGGIPMAFAALTPAGLTLASGELGTGSQQTTFDAMSLFLSLLTDPGGSGRIGGPAGATPFAAEGAASAYAASGRVRDAYGMFTKAPPLAAYDPRWQVWAAGYGGSQTTGGNAVLGSNNTASSVFGTAVGVDYVFSPRTIAGFALAGGGTNFSVVNSGSGRSDLFQAGAFIRHSAGPAYISAALAYGWQDITTDRTVSIAGVDRLRAEFNANAWSGRLEGGYRFVAPWAGGVGLTPYAAGQFTTFDLPAYAEGVVSGAGTFALAYGAKSVTDSRSELGLRTDKSFAMDNGIFTLRGRLAWAHDDNPDRSIGATFQTLPGASFVVNGAAQASDSALTTAAAEFKWINGWSAAATFEGGFSSVTQSYAGKGVVRYTW
ncbi:autotransporter outer membrane beta-barrel domain-containing protein [Bradyrhizobium sp. LTSP885]|uniref:autotransporter outer membrane beta-barrel domain-containing protein n=1 Tax=Bradyrhizobium sp. LTSP885 TaxID=1619232 RepID=UPI001FDAAC90|nr:autotransporter outer membrane beta-barrel domain-containing protein [Bradyrhizobium sp. LTSP885]